MKYIYTYQTKNVINGKTYIGVHSTNKLNDGYIGNGVTKQSYCDSQIRARKTSPFVLAVNKYGYSNFKKEILCFFDNIDDAYEEESFLVDYEWIKSNSNYNVAIGGMYNKKSPKLYEFKDEINKMFENPDVSYKEIDDKFSSTKGSWIKLITDDSRNKRKASEKESFYKGIEVININGDIEILEKESLFFKKTGLNKKTIHKIKKNGYCSGWYLKGHEKYIIKINEIKDKWIVVNNKRYELKEVYTDGVSNFSKKHGINLATLEKKINNSKNIKV